MTRGRRWMRAVAPPFVIAAMRAIRERLRPANEYVPQGWARADEEPRVRGWNAGGVVEGGLKTWQAFVDATSGSDPLTAFHEVPEPEDVSRADVGAHNLAMSYGYVAAMAAGSRERLSILDWGGGLGHYYLLTRALLPDTELEYHCLDRPELVAEGSRLLPQVTFHSDVRWTDRSYDLVLASGALQYNEDWQKHLRDLACAADPWLFVARLPVVPDAPSFVVLQHAERAGYDSEFLGWVLNRRAFLSEADQLGLELVREFLSDEHLQARGGPEPAQLRGFLFRRAASGAEQ
jgi:putative methyltransferase (TIGR04325 family)